MAKVKSSKSKLKNKARKVDVGRVYLYSSYNNTILTFTDENGDVLAWSSAGVVGFKNSKKSTPYAGQKAAEDLNKKIMNFGTKEVTVYIRGKGAAIPSTIKELGNGPYRIVALVDNNRIRFGGTRPRKKPRK